MTSDLTLIDMYRKNEQSSEARTNFLSAPINQAARHHAPLLPQINFLTTHQIFFSLLKLGHKEHYPSSAKFTIKLIYSSRHAIAPHRLSPHETYRATRN